jgi:two-component system phosphate regulon response regulator PhoB
MERPGRVLTRGQLVTGVWGNDSDIEERTVDVQIKRLRAALNTGGGKDVIRTVRSAGYSLG